MVELEPTTFKFHSECLDRYATGRRLFLLRICTRLMLYKYFVCKCPARGPILTAEELFMLNDQIDGLVQERRNSIANALELRLSCTNPLKWCSWNVATFGSLRYGTLWNPSCWLPIPGPWTGNPSSERLTSENPSELCLSNTSVLIPHQAGCQAPGITDGYRGLIRDRAR